MSWINNLKERWGVSSTTKVVMIFLVFACTGFTIMLLKNPVIEFLLHGQEKSFLFTVIYFILILPVYNVFLLIYGFILGQFKFFWEFEKRTLNRLFGKKTKKNRTDKK